MNEFHAAVWTNVYPGGRKGASHGILDSTQTDIIHFAVLKNKANIKLPLIFL